MKKKKVEKRRRRKRKIDMGLAKLRGVRKRYKS